jgi:hypothetical protein
VQVCLECTAVLDASYNAVYVQSDGLYTDASGLYDEPAAMGGSTAPVSNPMYDSGDDLDDAEMEEGCEWSDLQGAS